MPEVRLNRASLSLGSNIDKERNIVEAVRLLAEAVSVVAVSSVYETAPVGNPNQESFLNAAVVIETPLSAEALKREVLGPIEHRLGRRRTPGRNAPRTIDIDIALFNDQILRVGERRIPDPDVLTRAHVAVPLAEVAPDYRHPVTGETLAAIAARLAREGGIVRHPGIKIGSAPDAPGSGGDLA